VRPSRPYHSYTAYHREPGGLRRLDFFVDRIGAWQGTRERSTVRVLDVGCGNGNIALALAGAGYRVTGVDLDAEAIARAASSARDTSLDAEFIHGSFDILDGKTYDVIIGSEVLEHQTHPTEFLDAIAAHLAPGGLLLISVPNGHSFEERIRKFTTRSRFGSWLKRWIKQHIGHQDLQSSASHPHEQFFSPGEIESLLRTCGWRPQDVRQAAAFFKEFFYVFGRLFMKRGSSAFHALDALDDRIAPHLPLWMSDGWLIEASRFDPKRPLVIHVIPTLASGGAERFVYDIGVRLPDKGFDVQVVSILRGGPLEPLFREGTRLTILNSRGPFGVFAVRDLVRLFRRERPTVVHTHLFGADAWGRIAAWIARVPVVISTEHNVNADHGALKRTIKGWLSHITTRFIAISEIVRRNMMEREHIPAKLITVIPNGIDMAQVIARPPRGFRDVPKILTVGRLTQQKGQATLLKALALVKGPWTLEIIGAGELETELRELAERLGIAARIHWLGFREDVPRRLSESDLFVFPSRWEGFGLALLEAAAAGVPCIASDLGVFHEFLAKENAAFVPVGDVPSLSHALQEILRDPYSAIERARIAGERLRTSASIETTASAYAALYRRLLKPEAV